MERRHGNVRRDERKCARECASERYSEDDEAVDAEAIRVLQKEEQDKRARAAMASAAKAEAEAGAGAGAGAEAGAGAGAEQIQKQNPEGRPASQSEKPEGRPASQSEASAAVPSSQSEKLGVQAPPVPTATKLSFNKTCARPGCPRADPREAARANCGLVKCSHCEVAFWCGRGCAAGDWERHRTAAGECRPTVSAPTAVPPAL